jgi:putative ABC transport system permease protein
VKRLLLLLIRVFPSAFRKQFADDMAEQIECDLERARARSSLAALWFTIATALDLVRAGIAERRHPGWIAPSLPLVEDSSMSWNGWITDLRHGLRALRRSPGFTTMAVGTLGLAIGANAGIFSVVKTVLLDPFPYANVDRLVHIVASAPGSDYPPEFPVSSEFYLHYRERSRLIEDVSTYNSFTNTFRTPDRVERIRMSTPTSTLFSTLGARPILGRVPVDADEDRVVVISHALWSSWFGGDSSVIGRTYEIGGASRTVVGVMGPEFRFPEDGALLWLSGVIRPHDVNVGRFTSGPFGGPLVARLKPGVTPEMLARELTALARELPDRFGGSAAYARLISQHRAVVRPIDDELLGSTARPLWVLLAALGIVLLVACANVANLFLVRAEARQRDLAVRRAMGAGRAQLVRLQMAEAIVVAGLAGVLAAVLAMTTLPMILRAAPPGIPRLEDVHLDTATVLFTLGVAMLSAIVCGFAPATRASAPDLTRLREGGRGSTRARQWARDSLVVAQTAMALVLVIGSALLVRSFRALSSVDPGYETDNLFTFQIAPEGAHLVDAPAFARFHLDFMQRLRALPGVQSVGIVENVPLNEGTLSIALLTEDMPDDATSGVRLSLTWAAGDYFQTMGIDLLGGRTFEDREHSESLGNVIVSRAAADRLWPRRNPIGRRIRVAGAEQWHTVVGVVEDVLQNDFRETPNALVYFPLVSSGPTARPIASPAYVLKTPRAETIAAEVRALVREIAPTAPMYRVFTMAGLAADSMVQLSFTMLTLGIVSVLALILGVVGLYGVLSFVVAQRTREIGVRMALGAHPGQVRRMVVVQGSRVVGLGVAIGIAVALAVTRALDGLLYGVGAIDPLTFVGMGATMVAIGVMASYVPARRASSVDPIESLRGE